MIQFNERSHLPPSPKGNIIDWKKVPLDWDGICDRSPGGSYINPLKKQCFYILSHPPPGYEISWNILYYNDLIYITNLSFSDGWFWTHNWVVSSIPYIIPNQPTRGGAPIDDFRWGVETWKPPTNQIPPGHWKSLWDWMSHRLGWLLFLWTPGYFAHGSCLHCSTTRFGYVARWWRNDEKTWGEDCIYVSVM